MKRILLFGAGKSATVLIDYLLSNAEKENWKLVIADTNLQLALDKIKGAPSGEAVSFDIMEDEKRGEHIRSADIVISMLPAALHSQVAKDCIRFRKHLLTASYVDDEIRSMQPEIEQNGLLFLCEMGLDPGIDHMSAMKLIDSIHEEGGRITSFKSHCGGLVAPESDNNPWHYKISWNPRNVVTAGKAGAVYKKNGTVTNIGYDEVFNNSETVDIPALGKLAWYPNRDSLSYMPLYGLEDAGTFIRTTLRYPAFKKAWNVIVKAQLADTEPFPSIASKKKTYRQWVDESVALHTKASDFNHLLEESMPIEDRIVVKELFSFAGLLSDEDAIPLAAESPADVLQFVLENKLYLMQQDRDMIVMLHELEYMKGEMISRMNSSLIVKGEDNLRTAMATTVGLPLGIATRLVLDGSLTTRGLHIPVIREIYEPVLKELDLLGIRFNEQGV
jgi:saccharopine dehydrogenase-like NADP-dependent oxidoreductase